MEWRSVRSYAWSWGSEIVEACTGTVKDRSYARRFAIMSGGVFLLNYGVFAIFLYLFAAHYALAWGAASLAKSVFKFGYIRWFLFGYRIPGSIRAHLWQFVRLDLFNLALGVATLSLFVEVVAMEPLLAMVASGVCTLLISMVLTRYVFKP